LKWQGIGSENPQIFALGVKELWETPVPLDRVIHTMGWPLPGDAFGGIFMYLLDENLVALALWSDSTIGMPASTSTTCCSG
jgi:electron-transferring-flavoprotein dehydrogenase